MQIRRLLEHQSPLCPEGPGADRALGLRHTEQLELGERGGLGRGGSTTSQSTCQHCRLRDGRELGGAGRAAAAGEG